MTVQNEKMKNFKKLSFQKPLLFFILLLASFLRFYKLGKIPEGLNRDEAAIGYNAYSILKIGKDEYGKKFPLYFKSFGDWKMPVYIYLTVPSVAFFGLNELAVRFPSALFGILTILMVYFLTKELFVKINPGVANSGNPGVEELAAFLLAISPWHIDYSRQASEVNMAIFWLILGCYLLIKKNKIFLPLSLFCFILIIYTYHAIILLAVILFSYLLIIKPVNLINNNTKIKYFFLILLILFLSQLFEKQALRDKFFQQTLFNDKSLILERVILIRNQHYQDSRLVRFFHNKIWEGTLAWSEDYFRSLSTDFLFFGNDQYSRFFINKKSPRLNLIILLPFFIMGIYFILQSKNKKACLLIVWLLASPILPSIVSRSPNSCRNLPEVIPLIIISAFSICYFLNKIKNFKLKKILIILFFVLILLDFGKVSEEYLFHLDNRYDRFDPYYHEIITNFNNFEKLRGKSLVFTASSPENSPYIFVAFYQKIDPQWFLDNVKRYPADNFGFEHVSELGLKYQFRSIDWAKINKENIVYIDLYKNVPLEIKNGIGDKKIISSRLGEPIFLETVY